MKPCDFVFRLFLYYTHAGIGTVNIREKKKTPTKTSLNVAVSRFTAENKRYKSAPIAFNEYTHTHTLSQSNSHRQYTWVSVNMLCRILKMKRLKASRLNLYGHIEFSKWLKFSCHSLTSRNNNNNNNTFLSLNAMCGLNRMCAHLN